MKYIYTCIIVYLSTVSISNNLKIKVSGPFLGVPGHHLIYNDNPVTMRFHAYPTAQWIKTSMSSCYLHLLKTFPATLVYHFDVLQPCHPVLPVAEVLENEHHWGGKSKDDDFHQKKGKCNDTSAGICGFFWVTFQPERTIFLQRRLKDPDKHTNLWQRMALALSDD